MDFESLIKDREVKRRDFLKLTGVLGGTILLGNVGKVKYV